MNKIKQMEKCIDLNVKSAEWKGKSEQALIHLCLGLLFVLVGTVFHPAIVISGIAYQAGWSIRFIYVHLEWKKVIKEWGKEIDKL